MESIPVAFRFEGKIRPQGGGQRRRTTVRRGARRLRTQYSPKTEGLRET